MTVLDQCLKLSLHLCFEKADQEESRSQSDRVLSGLTSLRSRMKDLLVDQTEIKQGVRSIRTLVRDVRQETRVYAEVGIVKYEFIWPVDRHTMRLKATVLFYKFESIGVLYIPTGKNDKVACTEKSKASDHSVHITRTSKTTLQLQVPT